MAGIFDRVKGGAECRLPVHLLHSGAILRAIGAKTADELVATIKVWISDNYDDPVDPEDPDPTLTAAQETDIRNVLANVDAQPDAGSKALYCQQIECAGITSEMGTTADEATFKALLGIP